ncbi:nuclease-related domain-containing protein [Leifsonia sp. fls2-241-R2A-40a]|uniref:nuclease-related domain-containing protein n=1 Tax=Leifsonia sp. fls2-241-R2A-40a TaxID=3040290 RepID=UPI0025505BCE|nr:nuclease-related domain-containing protein [Leifsonia sp. fls2-241-R2A-40a]
MRDRAPGAAVMEQVVRLQQASPPRSPLARAFGVHPLPEDAHPWFSGALGEREVGAALDRLPAGWSAFHAVPVGSGEADVDHLVVGPGGVFVINTKHHRGGSVTVYQRAVLVNGAKQPYLRNSDFEASRVRGLLLRAGIEARVQPVIAVVGAKEVRFRQQPSRATLLRAESLVRWLSRRPAVLDAATVARAAHLFDDPATWRPVASSADTTERFDAIARQVRCAQLVRAGWGVAFGLGLFAVALPFLPH